MIVDVSLNQKNLCILIDLLEEKLDSIPVVNSSDRYDYGFLSSYLQQFMVWSDSDVID